MAGREESRTGESHWLSPVGCAAGAGPATRWSGGVGHLLECRHLGLLGRGSRRPHQPEAGHDHRESDQSEESRDAEAHRERGGGHAADAEVADEGESGRGPDLPTGRSLDRVGPIEAGPVLAVVLEVVRVVPVLTVLPVLPVLL